MPQVNEMSWFKMSSFSFIVCYTFLIILNFYFSKFFKLHFVFVQSKKFIYLV